MHVVACFNKQIVIVIVSVVQKFNNSSALLVFFFGFRFMCTNKFTSVLFGMNRMTVD